MPRSTHAMLWLFFVLVFGWTWSFWIAAAVSGTSVQTNTGRLLLFLGLLGPLLGGIGFTSLTESKERRRDYWRRAVEARRIPARWWLVIFLFVPALLAGAALLDVILGGVAPVQIGKAFDALLATPLAIVPVLLRIVLQGPLPEELGWRGYSLDRLQARWNALVASLILGAIWALWHFPLFFIRDMLHAERGAWSAWFWLFMIQTLAAAVIYTWIYNNTHRSILAAILFHFISNLSYEVAQPNDSMNFYIALLWVMSAIGVVAYCGARTLTRHRPTRH